MKTETDLQEMWCPWRVQFVGERCIGFACSQCVDGGPVYETQDYVEDTDTGEPKQPDGEGWIYFGSTRSKERFWRRETSERYAYCGRNIGEALRQELSGLAFAIENINNPGR